MALLVGTDAGVFRATDLPVEPDDAERVLEGRTTELKRDGNTDAVFAATTDDLYRSGDEGRTWQPLAVPGADRDVWSVLPTDGTLFAGTNGPALYRSIDGGESWTALSGFLELPSRERWMSPVDPDRARVRTLASPPDVPDRVVAGIESGGVHISDDGGDTWTDRQADSPDDVHHVLALGPEEYLVAAGFLGLGGDERASAPGGLHRTTDAGATWERLDADHEHTYIRRVAVHDGRLYHCGSRTPPPAWRDGNGADAALFEAPSGEDSFERVPYPGEPRELVLAWTTVDGALVGGTGGFVAPDSGERGRLIRRTDGEWETAGRVPGNVIALETVA